ncbi:DUF5666 domain-containing protein [Luteimonas sp. MJ246]|uniref:DUF5666 domain-containing protein n=1 Tax=Luteimonas sp. MJ174 TaxID=3129237 RepID=UPI0031BB661F
MRHTIRGIAMLLATSVLLLAGCASTGGYGSGSYPGDYGQPDRGYPAQYGGQLQGVVDSVDRGYKRILLRVDDPRSGRMQQAEVRYDQRTRLFYQGRESAVEGLERGDVIRMDVTESGRDLWARSIEVVRNVRERGYGRDYGDGYGNGYGDDYGDDYGNDLRGPVALVDTRSRLIRLDGDRYGDSVQLAYDGRTTVEYRGRRYRPEDLERGDLVRVQARRVGNNRWLAERIIVERSIR